MHLDLRKVVVTLLIMALVTPGVFAAGANGKQDFLNYCARCHGADGKGSMPAMRNVSGYRAVDLTVLTKENGGKFPRQKVYDTLEGKKRFQAHLVGDMPQWGLKFKLGETPADGAVKARIDALVDYIKTLQAP